MRRGSREGRWPPAPPFDDSPFGSPGYPQPAPMPPVPGHQPIPHWFTTKVKITLVACVVVALGLGVLGAMGIYWAHRSGPPSNGDCLYLTREGAGKLAAAKAVLEQFAGLIVDGGAA